MNKKFEYVVCVYYVDEGVDFLLYCFGRGWIVGDVGWVSGGVEMIIVCKWFWFG